MGLGVGVVSAALVCRAGVPPKGHAPYAMRVPYAMRGLGCEGLGCVGLGCAVLGWRHLLGE